ncbi:MAG: hypothetical protein IJF11_02580 [Clostridia bacterium]|nr:hypothetical protein [Clostridia bacterium]
MKYTTPTYEVEAVETVDVITASYAIEGVDPTQAAIRDVVNSEGEVIGKEVAIFDVNILL